MTVGLVLVGVVLAAGLYFAFRPAPLALDGWFTFLVTAAKGTWFTGITDLRYPAVILAGSVVAAAVTFRRDTPRAWACLIGPGLALISSELALKPAVGRTLGGVYSYPSGSVVGASALATVAVLAVPARWRPVTVVVASVYALWMALAVVAGQWHLPTDAAAGLAYGSGVVLVIDALAWVVAVRWRRRSAAVDREPERPLAGRP